MAIVDVKIFREKKNKKALIYALKEVYGVGLLHAKKICNSLGYDFKTKVKKVKNLHLKKIDSIITTKYNLLVGPDLSKKIYSDISKMRNVVNWRGIRHKYKLPVNGQRTKNNAKTRKLIDKIKRIDIKKYHIKKIKNSKDAKPIKTPKKSVGKNTKKNNSKTKKK